MHDHDNMPMPPKQAWIAFILTAGEFITALILAVNEGHYFALYLATTYAVRETEAGRAYHIIVVRLFRGAYHHFKPKKKEKTDVHSAE